MNSFLNHDSNNVISQDIMNISKYWLIDEEQAVTKLVEKAKVTQEQKANIYNRAYTLVEKVRKDRLKKSGIDAFMIEYDLSSEEGIVLMCLAEALLRIPDKYTIDLLIKDKLSSAEWKKHVGSEKHLFVNAATWSLVLTGNILKDVKKRPFRNVFQSFVQKSSEPIIRKAIKQAMKIVGKQYVLGETIQEALSVSKERVEKGYTYSYDMLGEAAMTMDDADYYYSQYIDAIKNLAKTAHDEQIKNNPGISVKLSALHPRYEIAQHTRVHNELYPKLLELTQLAKKYNVGMNIDAEETERLQISLELVERLANEESLQGFNGIGIVVQAYQKRAPYVLEYLANLARKTNRKFMIRLVKGAYWDAEIKHAQEQGLENYPVFTRKYHTDVSYQACAKQLFENIDCIYPQFATHNAQTVASIFELAGDISDYEFQCLHGMGDPLYDNVVGNNEYKGIPCRIYAPVGGHEHLLAYLVRRLLENGANSSFVNRIVDESQPIESLIEDPIDVAKANGLKQHPDIVMPKDIVAPRLNSKGYNINDFAELNEMYKEIEEYSNKDYDSSYILDGKITIDINNKKELIKNPSNNEVFGSVVNADKDIANKAVEIANDYFETWNNVDADARAIILEDFADLLEQDTNKFIAIAMSEAGKTLANAIDEVREAVDFCRYYANQAREEFTDGIQIPCASGKMKKLEFSGRGPMVCISPWNFPLAIFLGQITAALASGNTVIAKPAEQTPTIAFEAVKLLFDAGLPTKALQFVPGLGETVGDALVKNKYVKGVIFTGSTEVAKIIQKTLANKTVELIPLVAETGGQNAMIVDSSSLPEQVVADVIKSSFDSVGQRCSALRVLCLQEEIADNYIKMIIGAMKELKVGNSKLLSTDVGPVIDKEASDGLNQYIKDGKNKFKTLYQVEENEDSKKGNFVLPIAFEIKSFEDLGREQFGPVLHILRFKGSDLHKLVDDINSTGYGLTCGVHSRINEVMNYVKDNIRAGNTYVNRNIVGAVVGVQPFGGQGKSGTGPKAGGPFYMHRLAKEHLDICNKNDKETNISDKELNIQPKKYTVSCIVNDSTNIKSKSENLYSKNKDSIGKINVATSSVTEKAISIAKNKLSYWGNLPAKERISKVNKAIKELENKSDIIISALVNETNICQQEARKQLLKSIELCNLYCNQAEKELVNSIKLPGPTGEIDELSFQYRGVVASICSTDDSIVRFIAPIVASLLAGNTTIAKPSYNTNIVAYEIVKIFINAGINQGVLQLLTGSLQESTATILYSEDVSCVALSGTTTINSECQKALSFKKGVIIPLIAQTIDKGVVSENSIFMESPTYLRRFSVEKTISIDTTASGGNASLMSLED